MGCRVAVGRVTDRKPGDVSWQSWIDRQITDAQRAGGFDGLSGHGRPIAGLDQPLDEAWWVREKLRREEVSHLPPTLAIRRDREEAVAAALGAPDEAAARGVLEQVNARIRHLNSHVVSGPPTTVGPVDVDEILTRWRTAHPPAPSTPGTPAPPGPEIRRGLRRVLPRRRRA